MASVSIPKKDGDEMRYMTYVTLERQVDKDRGCDGVGSFRLRVSYVNVSLQYAHRKRI